MTDTLLEVMARAELAYDLKLTPHRFDQEWARPDVRSAYTARNAAAISALEAEGYVVVPVEPTPAMMDAGTKATGNPHLRGDVQNAWTAMLSAREPIK